MRTDERHAHSESIERAWTRARCPVTVQLRRPIPHICRYAGRISVIDPFQDTYMRSLSVPSRGYADATLPNPFATVATSEAIKPTVSRLLAYWTMP